VRRDRSATGETMKGIRFYEEFTSDTRTKSEGNVVAVLVVNGRNGAGDYDAIAAVDARRPNAPVAGTPATSLYLRERCKRISEKRAREIHPRLFSYLRWSPQ